MTDEDPDAGHDFAIVPSEIPVWPNLPEVHVDQRRRAWCLAMSLESISFGGKDVAKAAVAAAAAFEEYIVDGLPPKPKLHVAKD